MHLAAIIQARMSSKRLPGKVLMTVDGKPMLKYLHERLSRCRYIDHIVVSTSTDTCDDRLAAFSQTIGITCFRGPLTNVAGRFKATLDHFGFDAFVRVNGDSPLLDYRLVDRGIDLLRRKRCDLVTNVFPRTYPAGQSVEVMRSDAFRNGYARMKKRHDMEHVTPFFYRRAEAFKIYNFTASEDYRDLHLAVDTTSDFNRFSALVTAMQQPHWEYGLGQLALLCSTIHSQTKSLAS